MRRCLIVALTVFATLAAAASAQAVVVNDAGSQFGVALVPGVSLPAGVSAVSSSSPCSDPGLTSDLAYQSGSNPLCWHGGSVLHQNETYALTWDPKRRYWAGTRGYVEQFLRDVANSSGSLDSEFAVATQYRDGPGSANRAQNSAVYGGGCIDYGSVGGYTCAFGNSNGSGTGRDYTPDCKASGASDTCVTDAQIRQEVSHIAQAQLIQRTKLGYAPLVEVLVPQGVEVCLDSGGNLCSANSAAKGQFCSYHAQTSGIAYVVQPWTTYTGCDEPSLPALPPNPTPTAVETDAGLRLVNPLSQAQIAAIVNPLLTGWYANDGSEIDDDSGCPMGGPKVDTVPIGSGSYVLRREFNNAVAIASDPFTYFGCAPNVVLAPQYVVPSAVNAGDVVEFDGSATASTLIVPKDNYQWSFGDGTTATGPSVTHTYSGGGSFTVTLTVTDRGGNVRTLSQAVQVLGGAGNTVTPPSSGGNGLHARLQMLPQGLHAALYNGLVVRVTANERAEGIAYVSVSRAVAKRAGLKTGRRQLVVVGIGTVSNVNAGTVTLHLRLSRSVAAKLSHLGRVTLTVRLALVAAGGDHYAIDVAGRY